MFQEQDQSYIYNSENELSDDYVQQFESIASNADRIAKLQCTQSIYEHNTELLSQRINQGSRSLLQGNKNRSNSAEFSKVQQNIKSRIASKICNFSNKLLYPELMGPHPAYAAQSGNLTQQSNKTFDLRTQLQIWKRKYLKSYSTLKQQERMLNKMNVSEKPIKIQYSEKNTDKINVRIGAKYNKYSLQFKKNIVDKIQQQMKAEGSEAKSLRYYVLKEANLHQIHPKNITRWLEMKNLDSRYGGRRAKFPILQYNLAQFMKQNPTCKRRMIVQQAKKMMGSIGQNEEFLFSKGWYERFRARLRQNKVNRSIQSIAFNLNKDKSIDEEQNSMDKAKFMSQFLSNNKQISTNKQVKFQNFIKQQVQHSQDEATQPLSKKVREKILFEEND